MPPNSASVLANPRVADQSARTAEIERPTTERVLGTLRDVTNQTPATILQPSRNAGVNVGANVLPPDVPQSGSRFGSAAAVEATPPGGSQFGTSQFGSSQTRKILPGGSQPADVPESNATIVTPPSDTPTLPPLTP